MTFQNDCIVVDGNQYKGQTWRMAMLAAMAEQQGITDPLDLIVLASGSGMTLNINPGSCSILGQDSAFPNASLQGSYFGYNVGIDNSLAPATTGASPRSDLIIARAEDPSFAGTPWSGGGPAGQIVYPRIVANVANSVTTAPSGQSAIALARVDIPANTTVITQGMITDLRNVARPMRWRTPFQFQGSTWGTPSNSPVASGPTAWPANATTTIFIPPTATFCIINFDLSNAVFTLGGSGTTSASGSLYPIIGGTPAAPVAQGPIGTYFVASTYANGTMIDVVGCSLFAIPATIRNTTQTLQMVAVGNSPNTGFITTNNQAALTLDVEFQQLASLT